jgi:glycosyltransferase involved in cell wall biosynthesis
MVSNHFSLDGKITRIIPYGNCLERSETGSPSVAPPSGRFLFTIGAVLPKKNFHVLVPLLKKLKGFSLVIAGDNTTGYAGKIEDDARYWGVDDRILFTGQIEDREKFWWYRHCEAFVFPSLAEGFGLPVIEAMSLGKPVFISSLTSLPEAGGTEAFYWESFDPDTMAAVFEAGMNDYHRSAAKAQRITAWAATFSWENTARRYLDLYAVITR